MVPDRDGQRQRSGIDVEDDADAGREGLRAERERDARGRAVADDALAAVPDRARLKKQGDQGQFRKILVGLSPKP